MSTMKYTPLSVRVTSFLSRARAVLEETRRTNPTIISISSRLRLDTSTVLFLPLFILTAILLLDPDGIAPPIANTLALLPSLATLRQIDRPQSSSKVEQGRFLLDYWVCVGTSFLIEQMLSAELVGDLVPIWWFVKGIAGITVWISIDVGGRGKARDLKLDTNKVRSTDTLAEPEPSPSPIGNCISALARSALPSDTQHSSAAANFQAKADPHTILRADGTPRSSKPSLTWGQIHAPQARGAPGSTPLPFLSPRDQLEAFLEDTSIPSPGSEYRRNLDVGNTPPPSAPLSGPVKAWLDGLPSEESDDEAEEEVAVSQVPPLLRAETITDWSERRNPADFDDGSDGGLSPEFIFDGLLPDSAPLTRLPGYAEALDGGPQARDRGRENGGGVEGERTWKQDMTLDDLLEMEKRGV